MTFSIIADHDRNLHQDIEKNLNFALFFKKRAGDFGNKSHVCQFNTKFKKVQFNNWGGQVAACT